MFNLYIFNQITVICNHFQQIVYQIIINYQLVVDDRDVLSLPRLIFVWICHSNMYTWYLVGSLSIGVSMHVTIEQIVIVWTLFVDNWLSTWSLLILLFQTIVIIGGGPSTNVGSDARSSRWNTYSSYIKYNYYICIDPSNQTIIDK
jgi:hypothetical protein